MSRQGIEWVDKIAFDSMKLALQLDDSLIGIVHAPSEDRSDVDACKLIYCQKFLICDIEIGRF
jgi:hypothetical protein